MRSTQEEGRHLSPDEIAQRVFPVQEGPVAVPSHLMSCGPCQERVARLREAWLRDRGAVDGVVDALPEEFWARQASAVMTAVIAAEGEGTAAPAAEVTGVHPFPAAARRSFFRHPVLAFGSLAAALLLVAGITAGRFRGPDPQVAVKAPSAPVSVRATPVPADSADEELLLSIDQVLSEDGPAGGLLSEEML